MSFTQEKETNLHAGPNGKICNGCDKHCEFGVHYFFRRYTNRIEEWFCPTIGGTTIKQYKGQNGQIIDATRKAPYYDDGRKSAKEQAFALAHEIVKFCDHYKVR